MFFKFTGKCIISNEDGKSLEALKCDPPDRQSHGHGVPKRAEALTLLQRGWALFLSAVLVTHPINRKVLCVHVERVAKYVPATRTSESTGTEKDKIHFNECYTKAMKDAVLIHEGFL